MTEHAYEIFGREMDKLPKDVVRMIAYNMRCYDMFIVIPDDSPDEIKKIVNDACDKSKFDSVVISSKVSRKVGERNDLQG